MVSDKTKYFIPAVLSFSPTSNLSHHTILITELLDSVLTLQTKKS